MLLTLSSTLPHQSAAYPDLTERSAKKKNKDYILQYGRAFITHYLNSGSRDFLNGRLSGRYRTAELYANGEQPVKVLLKDENGQPDTSGDKMDLRKPMKLLKKSLRAVDGKLKDHDFVATVTPIDATAQDEKRAYEARMRVQMEHGAFLQSLGLTGPEGPAAPGTELPIDEDDLAMHMEFKYRHRDAMLLEMKIALALYLSDYAQVNRHCLRDENTYGSSVLYLGLRGPRRLPQRLYPGNCLFLPSDTEDYANLQAGAHIERISLAQVLAEIEADPDTTLDKNQREQLETLARQQLPGQGRNYYYDSNLKTPPEMAGQLEVVRFSFKSQDAVGKKGKGPRPTLSSWYEGSLIVGTEIGYGCRRAYEQLRDEDNPFDCHPLYVVTSPDMLGGFTESVVEQCMMIVDMACDASARLRFKLNTMVGSWLEFDIDAIEASALKKNNGTGAQMSAQETIAHFFRNGYIAARKGHPDDPDGKRGNLVTAGELPFEREIAAHWNTIAQCRQEIEAITGINGSISADDPASRQSVGTTKLAIQGAENTLEYLYFAKQRRFERVIRALAVSLKQSEARAPLTGSVPPGYNAKGIDVVGTSDTLPGRTMQAKIERKPTDQQWRDFYESAKVAMNQKEITLSDYSFLLQIDNLKQATAMLGIRARRNQQQASQSAEQQTTMASQQQMDSARVTAEELRKTNAELHAQKMELEALRGQNAVAAAQVQVKGQLDAAELLNLFKAQQQQHAQLHAAQQAAQQQQAELVKEDARLTSQEEQAALQRASDAEIAAKQAKTAAKK